MGGLRPPQHQDDDYGATHAPEWRSSHAHRRRVQATYHSRPFTVPGSLCSIRVQVRLEVPCSGVTCSLGCPISHGLTVCRHGPVRRIWPSPHSDIAFLKLEPWSETATKHKWRWPVLNVLPPAVGSRVSAFGYHSSFITPGAEITWQQAASNSHGRVEEVFDVRRDTVQLAFPCFSVDARFDGGMIGGPVFNEAGEMCGLVCSSIPAAPPETRHTSFVTSLWPALGVPLDMNRVGKPQGFYPAIELARGLQPTPPSLHPHERRSWNHEHRTEREHELRRENPEG